MIRIQPSTVMKYVDRLDAFVRFHVFSPEELQELLRDVQITDRVSYMDMVVGKCVAWLPERAQKTMAVEGGAQENVREVLYDACIGLNPGLDIRRVLLPVGDQEPAPKRQGKVKAAPAQPKSAKELARALRTYVVAQDEAVEAVATAIARAAAGLRDPDRPVGTFLFVGPTGVGKTELAKALGRELSQGGGNRLIRIDCSEYSQPHEYAKLIGAPPGYVGYEQGGYLGNVMAEAEGGVLLFDEIEKADERVHNLLLQIMDEGHVTDAKGQRLDFTDSVVILTSNLGAVESEELRNRLGFGMLRREGLTHAERVAATRRALGQRFKPEFMNRIDETVVFRSLTRADAATIVSKFVGQLAERARRRGTQVELDEAAREWLIEKGFSDAYGARELRRCLQRYVESPLADALLEGRLPRRGRVRVGVETGEVRFEADEVHRPTRHKAVPHRTAPLEPSDGKAKAGSA